MKSVIKQSAAFLLVLAFVSTPAWATCGGGGGGGGGGMTGSGGSGGGGGQNPVVYHVPWKMPPKQGAPVAAEGLILTGSLRR